MARKYTKGDNYGNIVSDFQSDAEFDAYWAGGGDYAGLKDGPFAGVIDQQTIDFGKNAYKRPSAIAAEKANAAEEERRKTLTAMAADQPGRKQTESGASARRTAAQPLDLDPSFPYRLS